MTTTIVLDEQTTVAVWRQFIASNGVGSANMTPMLFDENLLDGFLVLVTSKKNPVSLTVEPAIESLSTGPFGLLTNTNSCRLRRVISKIVRDEF